MTAASAPPIVIAIVPVGRLEGAKSRLGAVARRGGAPRPRRRDGRDDDPRRRRDARDRRDARGHAGRRRSAPWRSRPARDRSASAPRASTHGLREARAEAIAAGAAAILIVPIDLPGDLAGDAGTDRRDARRPRGRRSSRSSPTATAAARTRSCWRRPTSSSPLRRRQPCGPCRGGDGRRRPGLVELDGPLAMDIDTPDDLLLGDAPEPDARPWLTAVEVIAIAGLGEIVPGDDLPALIAEALAAARGRAAASRRRCPRRDPEGRQQGRGRHRGPDRDRAAPGGGRLRRALGSRRPPGRGRAARGPPGRPDGQRRDHHRDASRVRLRERRHRRLQRRAGVRQRRHAPARATRMPRRPRSGRPSASGWATTCPVIVSDSFGRPWRFGIVDVAIGVSGLLAARRPARRARRRRPGDALHRPGRRRRAGLGRGARPGQDRGSARSPSSVAPTFRRGEADRGSPMPR